MAASEAQKRASARYDAEHTLRFSVKLNTETDKDIIDALRAEKSKNGFIKQAIRFYLERRTL